MKKITKILITTLLITIALISNIYAADSIISIGDAWETTGEKGAGDTTDTSILQDASEQLFNMLLDVGVGVVFAVGAFLGIKFMTAGVEEKAEVKATLMPYFISSVILLGAYGIWKLSVIILKDLI